MSTTQPTILSAHPLGAAYPVTLPAFQGPLELLLHLIEKEELDISEISLVAVIDQYLRAIEALEEREPGALADFLVVASKLLFIKSRSLLPKPRPPVEGEDEDPSDALIKQLIEYRQFKSVASALQEREALGLRTYLRVAPRPTLEKTLDLSDLDVAKLQAVLRRVLQRLPSEVPLPRVKTYPITVAEQIESVRSRLQRLRGERKLHFIELLSERVTRIEVVVTFLAVLELIKQREIHAVQDETFGEILLRPASREEQTNN